MSALTFSKCRTVSIDGSTRSDHGQNEESVSYVNNFRHTYGVCRATIITTIVCPYRRLYLLHFPKTKSKLFVIEIWYTFTLRVLPLTICLRRNKAFKISWSRRLQHSNGRRRINILYPIFLEVSLSAFKVFRWQPLWPRFRSGSWCVHGGRCGPLNFA